MNAIRAIVRNGRIETDDPLDLPDGTELLVIRSSDEDAIVGEDDWDNSPEGIAEWLSWHDSLQPLVFTEDERKALMEDRRARKAWELAHADERAEKLQRLWE